MAKFVDVIPDLLNGRKVINQDHFRKEPISFVHGFLLWESGDPYQICSSDLESDSWEVIEPTISLTQSTFTDTWIEEVQKAWRRKPTGPTFNDVHDALVASLFEERKNP